MTHGAEEGQRLRGIDPAAAGGRHGVTAGPRRETAGTAPGAPQAARPRRARGAGGLLRTARRVALAALLVVLVPSPTEAGAPLPASVVDAVAGLATDLAQRGLVDEATEVLEILDVLGVAGESKDRARKAVAKAEGGEARPRGKADPAAIRRVAAALAEAAASAPEGPARRTLAEQALRLSGRDRQANTLLGHVLVEGRWVSAGDEKVPARRRAIADAAARARALDVPVSLGEATDPSLLAFVHGARGATGPDAEVQSAWLAPEEMARAVRTASQIAAFIWWTYTGTLRVPTPRPAVVLVVFSKVEQYLAWVDALRAAGEVSATEADWAKTLTSWHAASGVTGMRPETVATVTRTLLWRLWDARVLDETGTAPTPCLAVGQVNWASLLVSGLPIMRLASQRETGEDETHTTADPQARRRVRIEREAAAGLMGSHAWLRERARLGTDPPWRQGFVTDAARIGGADLLKATSVAEHLVETGRFWDAAGRSGGAADDLEARLAEALGAPIAAVEARWRDWLLADEDGGLAERIERTGDDPDARGAGWLAHVDDLRRAALRPVLKDAAYLPLRTDPDLCDGCRAHAHYLVANPDVATKWPDVHEERADRPGYSSAGARAGAASVIYAQVGSVAEAVDGWMATYYHRLPLLDPGLVRVGVGRERGTVVLDTQSMVARPVSGTVVWPPPDATNVPRRFASGELPPPLPGENQAAWGYPVTVQIFPEDGDPIDVAIELRRGGPSGPAVEGWLLTPSHHAQPLLHPPRSSCFIPKAPLEGGILYHVHTSGYRGNPSTYDWSFTTGKK